MKSDQKADMQGESSQLSAWAEVLDLCRQCITGCTGAVGQVCSSAGHSVLVSSVQLKSMPINFAYPFVSSLIRS